jgi:NADP-dependent 3-hydroxy acid dehydrogenase YdfG
MNLMKELVIVTGAGSGIGKATAIEFSAAGHPLLLLDRSGRSQELSLPNTICKKVDVADLDAFQSAVNEAEQKYGPVSCIVNNAGIMLLGQLDTQNPNEWKKMLEVNVLGVLNGIKIVLPKMKERKKGTIINVSSIAGRKTFANHSVYCATKFGVHALTENLREEVAKFGVRCVTIAPGVVETDLLSHTTSTEIKDGYSEWKKKMGQALNPSDVARSILFAYQQPSHVCIREIVLGPTTQEP